jgi:type IV pilus assembly protein PilM
MIAENLGSALDFLSGQVAGADRVDISSTSVKLVELVDAGKGVHRLERYVIEALPKDVVTDGNIANLDQVSDGLKRAWKRLGTRNRNVALALPAAMVITKKIIVPSGQKEEDLELTVEAEANQYIPFALDEVNLDFQILGPAPNNPDEVEVLIAASRKEKVEDRVAIAEAAGLKPRVMDVESYATQEAFRLIARRCPRTAGTRTSAWSTSAPTSPTSTCCATTSSCSPRPGIRRQPADLRHPARIQPVSRRGRVGEEEPRAAGEL